MTVFRAARPAPLWWNLIKTIAAIATMWFVVLFAIPIGISMLEVELGLQRIPPQTTIALAAFPFFTAISLWAALMLAVEGRGTPLAVDEPRQLVTSGPYAFVRHPIVLATIGQGISVGLAFGSVPVLIYIAVAGMFWYVVIKPREERNLESRFGDSWHQYRKRVRALIPRFPSP